VTSCPECGLTTGLFRDDLVGDWNCGNCGWFAGKPKPEAPRRLERCMTSHAASVGQCAVLAGDSICDLPFPHDLETTPHRMRSPYDARWYAADDFHAQLGKGGGGKHGDWPQISWSDWLAEYQGRPTAPAVQCDPAVWYTTDDDGIHLICEEHGDNLVGFTPTLAELILARTQHCGAPA